MGKIPTYKGEIVKEYLLKFPKASTMSISRLLVADYPIDFSNLETARASVRFYRGELGKKKNNAKDIVSKRTELEKKQFMQKNFELPESDYEKQSEIIVGNRNILFLSDIHFPYQNNDAIKLALDYGKSEKVDCVYLNGDTIDMYMLSRFIKDRRLRNMSEELEMTRNFLKDLQNHFQCPIYYKIGNHEERWQNFLKLQAPELLGIPDFELSTILKFGESGVQEVKSKQIAKAGKLPLLHGHEFFSGFAPPVNPARGLYLKAKESSIIGHHHRTSEHTEVSLSGDVTTTWSVGCLCGLQPEYMPFNSWNNGFAHIKVEKNGDYEVNNLRIIKNKIR
jgi:predicted phosphodiesterase